MEQAVVHRVIEQHAASHGDTPAIVDARDVLTYRDLNYRANAIARHLSNQGFRRSGHVLVGIPAGIDAATVMLAVLKCGGAYTWASDGYTRHGSVAIADRLDADPASHRVVDVASVLGQPLRPGSNLPVLTRPTDIACVVPGDGARPLLVPHSTLTSLRPDNLHTAVWEGHASTFDLWAGLMAGATLTVDHAVLREAA